MEHPDIELLSQFALDDPLALDAATLVHITDCERCRHEIEQMQRVVDATLIVGGRPDLRTPATPPSQVWDHISAALDEAETDQAPAASRIEQTPRPAVDDGVEQGWLFAPEGLDSAADSYGDDRVVVFERDVSRPTTVWQLISAAVVGVLIGAGGMWAIAQISDSGDDPSSDAASSILSGFDGHDSSGVAELTNGSAGPRLRIEFDQGSAGKGFIGVWLLDADTGGMIALGILEGDRGTFAVPRRLDLDVYNQIDISLEPFDGDPGHSAVSLARGPLP
jgi:hypothetical protein